MAVLTDNMRGALLMTGSMAAFTLNDACMKALGVDIPLFQALLLRGLGTSLLLYLFARYLGALRFDLTRQDWGLAALRGVGEIGAAWFFITALFNMPIANVTAILQALPLAVTLAAAVFFGEALGWRRMAAIGIGLCGVLLIVRPGVEGFNIYALYALAAVVCVTARDLATRRMSAHVPSMTIALLTSLAVTLFAAVGAPFIEWRPMDGGHALLILGTTLFVLAGYILGVMAMRVGEIGFVAPFRYVSLVVALIVGLVAFGEWPSALTLIGAAIVVATGLFTLYRERQLRLRGVAAVLPR